MHTFLSSPQKRATTLTIKALAFFFLILCSFIFAPRAFANTLSYDNLTGNGTFSTWDTNAYGTTAWTNSVSGNLEAVEMYLQANISMPFSLTVQLANGHTDAFIDCSATVTMNSSVNNSGNSFVNLITITGFTGTQCAMGTGAGDYELRFPVPTGGTSVGRGRQTQGNQTALRIYTQYSTTPPDTSTHIISFSPANNATTSNPVTFNFSAYVNANDIAGAYEIQFILHNIDQNVFLLSGLSPSDIYLINGVFATTSGQYDFSTTTTVGEGNYTLEASITQYIGWGWASLANPLSSVNSVQYHQFIVCGISDPNCHGTVAGNLQNNGYAILAGITGETTGSSTATSTLASCSPIVNNVATAFLNTNFDITRCAVGLLTPDPKQLAVSLTSLRDDTLKHIPFGYFTRLVSIFSATSTASLPSFTITLPVGPSTNMDIISLNPSEILAGGAAVMASGTDPISGKNLRDVAEPIVLLSLALSVLFTIVADLVGSHKHVAHGVQSTNKGKDT
jgi:hypothetical protein